jgi:dolichyl-phosphate beta-glucosyltransferase
MNKTITFVIPVYNEEDRIGKTFEALRKLRLPRGLKLEEVIFVNDGSTDRTKQLIRTSLLRKNLPITLISYPQNQGKGYAIRTGMNSSKSDYTLFFDADMSTPLTELKKFIPFMNRNIDVIVGTRKNGKSTVIKHQPLYRELLGRVFTKLTQLMLGVQVTDFTCGFKAFSRDATRVIFPQMKINGWGYDAELLFLAFQEGFRVQEKAVLWSNDERTKVNLFQAVPQTLLELITIHRLHTLPAVKRAVLSTPLRIFPRWATIK